MREKIDILFKYIPESRITNNLELPDGCSLVKFNPSIIELLKDNVTYTEFIWSIITAGNYVLYCVPNDNNEIIHKNARIGKCYKFNFLKSNEYEIGPCFISDLLRGKGIYPFVLKQL